MQIVDSFESTLQEYLEVVIVSNSPVYQLLLEEWINLKQVHHILLSDLPKRGIVGGCYRCGPPRVIQNSNLPEVVAGIQGPHLI